MILAILATNFLLISGFHLAIGSPPPASCVHGGTKYKDGDHFPPNQTFMKTEYPFQCVQCTCRKGLVVCEIENCTVSDCGNPIKHPGFCCLQCPGDFEVRKQEPDFDFPEWSRTDENVFLEKKEGANCLSNGRIHANGSVWQPVIGPFGAMACVRCECRDGNVVCQRLRCNNQNCSHPIREFGECCPVCPGREKQDESPAVCLPKTSEFFVFKTRNVQNDSETIEYAFLENAQEKDRSVVVHTWNLKPKVSLNPLTVTTIERKELEKWNLELLGSASQKRYKKFSQRGERLRLKCFEQCLKKINRLENSLGIRRVVSKRKCGQTEIDVSTF